MYRLVPTLVAEMGGAYPELKRAEALVTETLKLEEMRFRETLVRGLKLLDEATAGLSSGDKLAGEIAFKLYDTYGFPLDLTQDALRARGIDSRHRRLQRRAWRRSAQMRARPGPVPAKPRPTRCGSPCARNWAPPNSSATTPRKPKARSLRDPEGRRAGRRRQGRRDRCCILTNQTPFYGEVRRPGRRCRARSRRARAKGRVDRHREEARRAACARRRRSTKAVRRGRCGRSEGRRRTPPGHARQPFRHASAACRAEARARPACGAERFAGRARSPALRFQPSQSR